MAKMNRELTKELQEDIKRVGVNNVLSWLKDKAVELKSNPTNLFETLSEALGEGKLTADQLKAAITELEESGDKKIFLFKVDNIAEFDEKAVLRQLRKQGITPSKVDWVYGKPGDGPTFMYMYLSDGKLKIKFGEKQYNVEFDPATEKVEKTVHFVTILLVMDTETGFTELRLDNPGNKHQHRNTENKISESAYEAYYSDRMQAWFPDLKFSGFDLKPVAYYLAKKGKKIFRIVKDKSTISGGAKQTFATASTKLDVRDVAEFKGALKEGGDQWRTDDLTGYWIAAASDGELKKDLFMRISRTLSHLRIRRGCLEQELQYGISQIRQIQDKV